MRTPDPIADNQTEQTIIALTNGSADDATRDHATAALLSSVQKLIAKTEEIDRNLWKPAELERTIDARHKLICQACPVRKYVEDAQKNIQVQPSKTPSKNILYTLVSNPTSLLITVLTILNILMGSALVYATVGRQGFRDITDAVHLTKEHMK